MIALETPRSHRSLAGHVFALGVYVFIFGALAYLTYLNQGGIPGQLLLGYASSLPLAIAIGTVVEISRARQRLQAHHVVSGCLNAIVVCGVGGIWIVFRQQIVLMLLESLAIVWLTRYSAAASFLQPPSLGDLTGSTAPVEHRTLRTVATVLGAMALLASGIGLTGFAVFSQLLRPGGLNITIGG